MNLSSPRSKPPPLSVRPPSSSRSWTCLSLSSMSGRTDTARSASSLSRPSMKWPAINWMLHGRLCLPELAFDSRWVRSCLGRCHNDDDMRISGPFFYKKETINCSLFLYFFYTFICSILFSTTLILLYLAYHIVNISLLSRYFLHQQ